MHCNAAVKKGCVFNGKKFWKFSGPGIFPRDFSE
jgi:hypothetical protein